MAQEFHLLEATITNIHAAYAAGTITARQLTQLYLDRIEAYDRNGPQINSIITVNPNALEEASQADTAFAQRGLTGPLHGIPMILKDQMDAKGMPTTLGSLVLKDYYPDRDSFVTEQLRNAGAVIIGKATLGEMGRGDTHGSLFGSTRNPYDPARTVGGSSRRVGGQHLKQFRCRGHRSGGVRFHPPTCRMERHRRHASHRRACESWRSLGRLAPVERLPRPAGPISGGLGCRP